MRFFSFHMLLSFALVMVGCMKVDTDPSPLFCQIKEEIKDLSDASIYWDELAAHNVESMDIEEMLRQQLSEDLAIRIALLNNQDLQAVYQDLGIAKAQLAQAGLLKNPIFFLSYRFSTRSNITDLIDMSFVQNFLEVFLIPLRKRVAGNELEATKSKVMTEVLDVIAHTKIGFYQVQAAEQVWQLKKQYMLATELSFDAAKRLFSVGNITALEVSMKRSMYEQAKLDCASAEVAFLDAREQLNRLMGLWGCSIEWKLKKDPPHLPIEKEYRYVENDAISNSLDLKIAYDALKATAAEFGVDTTKLIFPVFDAGVSVEREEGIWYVGPAFNIPIPLFDFGKANSAKARAKILKQWHQFSALAVEIRSWARMYRFTFLNAYRQSKYTFDVVVPLAKRIFIEAFEQHNAMQLGVFRLLETKQNEIEKMILSVEKYKEYQIVRTKIETLMQGHVIGKHGYFLPVRKYYE
ncbi:MAG TPA: TolC family protein [Chlamydiales bacterium]|nr:TolC family protein [Chlamydiales bacterium]